MTTHDTPTHDTRTQDRDADATEEESTDRDTRMGSVDHTHPYRNTTFGSIFGRGPTVAADGGEPAAGGRSSDGERSEPSGGEPAPGRRSSSDERGESDGGAPATQEDTEMADVDHESPTETDATAVFERGDERADRGATEGRVADE